MESAVGPNRRVRACIFDMDGLLINSEDVITRCVNKLLENYGRPPIARDIRVSLMGVPNSTSSDLFHDWAKLPIAREQFDRELKAEMEQQFTTCEPLSGAEKLLSNLSRARSSDSGKGIQLALASSTKTSTYQLKISRPETAGLLGNFADDRRILGDDPRIGEGRGKPAPDIFLVALQALRTAVDSDIDDGVVRPDECLVFEDSVAGVKAGRAAGMRMIWVPHPDVVAEFQFWRNGIHMGGMDTSKLRDEWLVGEIGSGWVETISSLQEFDYKKYGIHVSTSENPAIETVPQRHLCVDVRHM